MSGSFKKFLICGFVSLLIFSLQPQLARAVFVDGEGHYGVKPATQTNPGFSEKRGLYQGTLQSLGLLGDFRSGDRLSLKTMFRVFENPRTSYLGDKPKPRDCARRQSDTSGDEESASRTEGDNSGSWDECANQHQDTNEPAYEPYRPKITEIYIEYAFEYCILQLGRRSRDWGMGLFLDSGRKPFAQSASIYDGVSCQVNPLHYETFGFALGYDRLAETGANVDVGLPRDEDKTTYGPTKTNDDIDQIFVSMKLDDRKNAKSNEFSREIGIYFANIFGGSKVGPDEDRKKVKSDIKYLDLYTGLYWGIFSLRNELLFRLGKTADPNWSRFGGASIDSSEDPVKSDVTSMAIASELAFRFGESGTYSGPKEYFTGTAQDYTIFAQYGYAPGDRDGYFSESERRDRGAKKVKAISFNRNFKPALIFFNGNSEIDDLRVDGIFDPGRVMNVSFGSLGLRYSSLQYGNFEGKFITAQLNVSIPREVKNNIADQEREDKDAQLVSQRRPIGYSGRHLGYELDLSYSKNFSKNLELGVAAGGAIAGPAWRTRPNESPESSYLIQGTVTFKL